MTRDEYMQASKIDGVGAHRAYYGQFVNKDTIKQVVSFIGANRIINSKDKHFNDIPLVEWDRIAKFIIRAEPFQKFGDYATLSGLVCIAKEAAQQYREMNQV